MNNTAIVLIIVLIILGFVYYFYMAPAPEGQPAGDSVAIEEVSSSDAVSTIDEELQVTEVDGLDQELSDVETEIEAALNEL